MLNELDVCRTCAENHEEMFNLLQMIQLADEEMLVQNLIKTATSLQVIFNLYLF